MKITKSYLKSLILECINEQKKYINEKDTFINRDVTVSITPSGYCIFVVRENLKIHLPTVKEWFYKMISPNYKKEWIKIMSSDGDYKIPSKSVADITIANMKKYKLSNDIK